MAWRHATIGRRCRPLRRLLLWRLLPWPCRPLRPVCNACELLQAGGGRRKHSGAALLPLARRPAALLALVGGPPDDPSTWLLREPPALLSRLLLNRLMCPTP